MFFSGCSVSLCFKGQTAYTSNFVVASLGVRVWVHHKRVPKFLQFVDAFGGALQFGPAGLHSHDSVLKFNLVVDESDVFGGIRFGGSEDVVVRLGGILVVLGLVWFFLGGFRFGAVLVVFEFLWPFQNVLLRGVGAFFFGLRAVLVGFL